MTHMPDTFTVSLTTADQYFRMVHGMKRLSEEETAKYLERIVRGFAERSKPTPNQWLLSLARDARDRLVEDYQPFVIYIAKRYQRRFLHLDLMDLIQEGNIGLLRAFDRFASSSEYSFSSVMAFYVRQAIGNAFYAGESEVAIYDTHVKSLLNKVSCFQQAFSRLHGYGPSVDEIAQEIDIRREKVMKLLQLRECEHGMSLQQQMQYEDGTEGKEDFVPLFASDGAHVGSASREDLRNSLEAAMKVVLSDKQQEVVRLLHNLDGQGPDKLVQTDLAHQLDITQTAVSARYQEALKNLRGALEVHFEGGTSVCELSACYQGTYYTVAEAAQRLGTSRSTIENYILSGKLAAEMQKGRTNGKQAYRISEEALAPLLADVRQAQAVWERSACSQGTYYTVTEAAHRLETSRATVVNYITSGKLAAEMYKSRTNGKQAYRIPEEALISLLADVRQAQAEQEHTYTITQAASLLGVARPTIAYYVSKGWLSAKKVKKGDLSYVLVPKQEVHALLVDRPSSKRVA